MRTSQKSPSLHLSPDSLIGCIASLSSPCNFQQGPLTHLMCKICSCLICRSRAMFVFALSCRKVDCEGGTAFLQRIHRSLNYSNYCRFHLVGVLLHALLDKVNKQKRTEHHKISVSSSGDLLTILFFMVTIVRLLHSPVCCKRMPESA